MGINLKNTNLNDIAPTKDFYLEVAKGTVLGHSAFTKFGENSDLDTGVKETVWSAGGTWTPMSSADTLTIVSSDANDDNTASGTLTLSSAVANTFSTGTVTTAGVQAADTVTVNGLLYTAVSGAKADNTEFSIDTSNDACAADLADSITNDARTGTLGDLSATSSTNVVTITTDVEGTAGDAVTLVSSNGTRLAVSGATFSGGVDADVATVNGLTYVAVAGAKADNTQFSIDTSDTAAATDLADSIANDARTGITEPTIDVTATSAAAVVTIHATTGGTDAEGIDISGTANITASGANLVGSGTGARTVTIVGVDQSRASQTVTYSLNGVTPVITSEQWLGVNRVVVSSAGSGAVNAGNITVTATSATTTQAYVEAGVGITEQMIFHLPSETKLYIQRVVLRVNKSTAGSDPKIRFEGWVMTSNGVKRRVINTYVDGAVKPDQDGVQVLPTELSNIKYWWLEATSDKDNSFARARVEQILVSDGY